MMTMDYPEQFTVLDNPTQIKVIHLGLTCWSIVQSEVDSQKELSQDELVTLWKERGKNDAIRERNEYYSRILVTKQSEIEDSLAEKDRLFKKIQMMTTDYEQELEMIKTTVQKQLERTHSLEITQLKAQLASLQSSYSTLQESWGQQKENVEETTRSLCEKQYQKERDMIIKETRLACAEELQTVKEELIRLQSGTNFQEAYQFAEKRFAEERERANKLQEAIEDLKRVKSSFHIGKDGENEIEGYLKQLGDYEYTNVAFEADKADFRVTTKEGHMMILDSKKFSHAVPKKDRDKLIDNTDRDASVSAGIMVSLTSKISARQHCEIEFTAKHKPILYLCFQHMTPDAKQYTLDTSIKLLLKLVQAQNEQEREELLEKIKKVVILVNDLKHKIENMKRSANEILETATLGLKDVKGILQCLEI